MSKPSPDKTSPFKSRSGFSRLVAATGYSWQGLKAAVQHEAAFRQELGLALILLPLAFLLARTIVELILLIGVLVMVLVVELINSAIEALADAISLEHNPLLGRAKDLGSAAVFLSFIFAILVWATVLVCNLLKLS